MKNSLERYNSLYDNIKYQAIAQKIADDLGIERESTTVSDALNTITNVALNLCGHTSYTDAWLTLASFCGQHPVSNDTIDQIAECLAIFRQTGDTLVDDFVLTAKALKSTYEALNQLKTGVSHANGIHGWRGRSAYDMLATCDLFAQVAVQLLVHGHDGYISEKLGYGLRRLVGALTEGIRHSDRPDRFDFSDTHFPDEHERH